MDLLITILLLLFCLLLANVISHYIPFVPTALIQVAIGLLLVVVFEEISFDIETEWFLLLFIAPLLYNDGRYFPREELWRMRGPILGNAVILVLLTTIGGGYFIHWMIGGIPLAAAFALAAILSPTDPVAVNGIAQRIRLPEAVLNLVRGESLINDASGLVAFNYAVAAVVTGYFSLQAAILDFSYKFAAGAVLGVVFALIIIGIRLVLRKQGITDVTFHSLLQILTPFLIFMITEDLLNASGVIAVVVAGIVHSLVSERTQTLIAEEQVLTENIWTIILFILNGIIFLLLGMNIPASMNGVLEDPTRGYWHIFSYVVAIGIVILGIRFVWAYVFSFYEYHFGKMQAASKPSLKISLLISLTGVRGTITMVGVLSLPFVLENGEEFPNRPLLLFLAAGTILFTLLVSTICLPLLSRGVGEEGTESGGISIEEARRRVLLVSIKKIRSEMNEENEAAAYELMDEYKWRFEQLRPSENSKGQTGKEFQRKMRKLQWWGIKAERNYIQQIKEQEGIDRNIYEAFEKSFDRREEAISNNIRTITFYLQGKLKRAWNRFRGFHPEVEGYQSEQSSRGRELQLHAMEAAVRDLENRSKKAEDKDIVNAVISEYKQKIGRLKNPQTVSNQKHDLQKEELRIRVLDTGRAEIFRMYEAGIITREQARELRRFINHIESVTLFELNE